MSRVSFSVVNVRSTTVREVFFSVVGGVWSQQSDSVVGELSGVATVPAAPACVRRGVLKGWFSGHYV